MCGIFAVAALHNVTSLLVAGLNRLEYRGYDSAGLAVIDEQHQLKHLKVTGKVLDLAQALNNRSETDGIKGNIGIAHTRWATHGIPADCNTHPMLSHHQLALVHNGIIENHDLLREELLDLGYNFTSQTDTEVIVHYLHWQLTLTPYILVALSNTTNKLQGSYALAILNTAHPHELLATKKGSPLVLGLGTQGNFLASDVAALLPLTQQIIYLDDGETALLSATNINIYNAHHQAITPEPCTINDEHQAIALGDYPNYMRKEIMEQSKIISSCLADRVTNNTLTDTAFSAELHQHFAQAQHIHLIACGSSFNAALTAKYYLESISKITASVETASEFRYRDPVIPPNTLCVVLSQSGETADTLAALRLAKQENYLATLAICNVPQSTITREADYVFFMRAGIEIGVAATKAFTTQLLALKLLIIAIAKQRHHLSNAAEAELVHALHELPKYIDAIIAKDQQIMHCATHFVDKKSSLFIGRGALYPIAIEGALKLKELSYIHAEACPAGELKHGLIALVDNQMPVVALAPHHEILFDKVKNNISAVSARSGSLYIITDMPEQFSGTGNYIISMPKVPKIIAPIIYSIPLQLLAYHVAVMKGLNVDQPRNLAKSVTVE